ncbi:MAG TPA: (d)CMP kinase [Candidatus Saccharimonadia bacterium]|jgi:cytidylate kinase
MTLLTTTGKRGMIGAMNLEPEVALELTNRRVVAVDGGTATGKGRLIEELSQLVRLKGVPVVHLSTGSLYRAVTWAGLQEAKGRVELVRQMGAEQLMKLARERQVEMHGGVVWMDGMPASVEDQLKAPGVGNAISSVAAHPEVRELVNTLTRRQINEFDGYLLIDGRDITHTVAPDAALKLLLTVSPDVAAQRSREHTREEIIARDAADRAHKFGALRHPDDPGKDVIVLPTDEHTPESVRDHVYRLMRKMWPELPEL